MTTPIEVNKTYTIKALAECLGKDEDWVDRHLLQAGLPYRETEHGGLISGRDFQEFVEDGSEVVAG